MKRVKTKVVDSGGTVNNPHLSADSRGVVKCHFVEQLQNDESNLIIELITQGTETQILVKGQEIGLTELD